MKWLKIKMFEPNSFGHLPSSGLKMMTVRSHIYILCDSRWEKFGDIRNDLFVQTGVETAQTFHKRRIVEGLMIQQFLPSLVQTF